MIKSLGTTGEATYIVIIGCDVLVGDGRYPQQAGSFGHDDGQLHVVGAILPGGVLAQADRACP